MMRFDASANVTRAAAVAALRVAFIESGVENPSLDARLLVAAAAGVEREDLIRAPEQILDEDALARLQAMAARRRAREPVSRILERREFWGLSLKLSPAALDPRGDTETLVEAAIAAFAARREDRLRVLDLGAGSGAILCALLNALPNAFGVAVEISPAAAALAGVNLAALGFAERSSVVASRWDEALAGRFDLVVSNPPYIASLEIDRLAPEVRHYDPRIALDGGPDGLDAYRALGAALRRRVAPGGAFFLEIGADQAEPVLAILAAAGLGGLTVTRDLAGLTRVIAGQALYTGELSPVEEATWRNAKKRLVLMSESSSAPKSGRKSRSRWLSRRLHSASATERLRLTTSREISSVSNTLDHLAAS
jgi:release factor glutamine methyltransferase